MEKRKPWTALFQRHGFFTEAYKHYLIVNTASKTKDAQEKWTGLVNSKIRWLVSGIEGSDAKSVQLVQPYIKGFERVHECKGQDQLEKTLDGSLEYQIKEIKTETVDQSGDVKMQVATQAAEAGVEAPIVDGDAQTASVTNGDNGTQKVYSTTYYLGIGLVPKAKSLDISRPVKTFQEECTAWPNYDGSVHSIRIKHVRE
jgi:poly(A) polymerase